MENVKNVQGTSVWLNNHTLFKTKINGEPFIVKKLKAMVEMMHAYNFNPLQNNWLTNSAKTCPRCKAAIRKEQLKKVKYASYFCYNCQFLFKK